MNQCPKSNYLAQSKEQSPLPGVPMVLNMEKSFQIEAILADNLRDETIQTKQVLVLSVLNKKELTKIISFLNKRIPLTKIALNHLKRIDSKSETCRIIVIPIESEDILNKDQVVQKTLNELDNDLRQYLQEFNINNFEICQVPSFSPLTRTQFNKASLFWPVNFHEDKYISKCINGTLFPSERLNRIYELMTLTVNLLNTSTATQHNLEFCSNNSCKSMSALIVKNDGKKIVASAISSTDIHPLNHAVINVINNVSTIHQKAKSGDDSSNELANEYRDDYLCTNYECFLSQEPCIMCAMALVHSRIKRVFFYSDPELKHCNECNDYSYSVHKIHIMSSLNHRYEAWKICPTSNDDYPNKKIKT